MVGFIIILCAIDSLTALNSLTDKPTLIFEVVPNEEMVVYVFGSVYDFNGKVRKKKTPVVIMSR